MRARLTLLALLLTGIVAGGALLRWQQQRSLASLPVDDRAALFHRTLDTLTTTCRNDALADHCREQAAFILQFPECDEACRAVATRFGPAPTR